MKKVIFLGGTCGKNHWRLGLIERLVGRGISVDMLFNPVVEHWDQEAQRREDEMKRDAAVILFYLGDPKLGDNSSSFYSLLEATMGLYDAPERTVIVFNWDSMEKRTQKAYVKAYQDLTGRFPDAPIFAELSDVENWLVERFVN